MLIFGTIKGQLNGLQGRSAKTPAKGGDAVEVKDAIQLMIGFAAFIVTLLSFIVSLIVILGQKRK